MKLIINNGKIKMKIVVKNAVKRKKNWIYFIDIEGNLRGYNIVERMKLNRIESKI